MHGDGHLRYTALVLVYTSALAFYQQYVDVPRIVRFDLFVGQLLFNGRFRDMRLEASVTAKGSKAVVAKRLDSVSDMSAALGLDKGSSSEVVLSVGDRLSGPESTSNASDEEGSVTNGYVESKSISELAGTSVTRSSAVATSVSENVDTVTGMSLLIASGPLLSTTGSSATVAFYTQA